MEFETTVNEVLGALNESFLMSGAGELSLYTPPSCVGQYVLEILVHMSRIAKSNYGAIPVIVPVVLKQISAANLRDNAVIHGISQHRLNPTDISCYCTKA